ncbi:hypothetical protein FHS55_003022 [Angulomicrobium tetraedrale]|uniref:Uncharacterized protein n=1 Tax=Ancylobacter tetraedralis TaxID=217068 RepID=A0A839ZC93_9HYPH|nr:hypothetical protein [Ancylobacter tetraedralis]MBB3772410.1 hypothetical protein [Ancylobacter tetraedralis]
MILSLLRRTALGARLRVEEGEDDAFCREGPGRARLALREEMARRIAAALASRHAEQAGRDAHSQLYVPAPLRL